VTLFSPWSTGIPRVYLELFINIVLIITIAEFNLIYMDSRDSFLALVNWKSSCILGTFY
jgi:hypothetical protein